VSQPPEKPIDKKTAFLRALVTVGSIKGAASAAHVNRGAHYDWLRVDPKYRRRFVAAIAKAQRLYEERWRQEWLQKFPARA
jgi:hypothetical protein